jgi:hypothetical protein
LAQESSAYTSETYRGVEIRVRCAVSPRNSLWSGTYSFFTGVFSRRRNVRIHGDATEKYRTQEEAIHAAFLAGREAVDREILTTELTNG